MKVQEGATVGAYKIIERIGRGGMATVYRAYHPALDRFVAIKALPDFFADDPLYRERFQQEARSVAHLKHPNILEIFDFGYEDGLAYLVLELVDGGTLADRLGQPLDLREAVRLLSQVAGALDHAHQHGILHRDIKPSNILIHTDGTAVLADFGLAKMAGSLRRLTSSGTVMGTPEYMSPEQAADEPIGPASDLYSFAVVAYEMLTGRVPFHAETPAAILLSHVTKAMPATHELRGELSAHVEDVLRRGLAKSPEDRFSSAAAFVAALKPAAWPGRHSDNANMTPATRRLARPYRTPAVLVVDDGEANRELIARVASALRLKSLYDSLDSAEQVIFALASAVEAKDPFTEAHTQRVAESARMIGVRLGLGPSHLDALYRGGLIHDIGKIGIPDAILLKPGPLDADEQITMHLHPIIGENIVAPLRSGARLLPIIRNHHEHFDGTGYPDRLSGAGIPQLARIVAVCDAFDALVNDRPYRARKTVEEALAILRDGAGRQWDPQVVEVFVADVPAFASLGAA